MKKIGICEKWTQENKMKINEDKSELMIIKGDKKLTEKYENKSVIKYLGIRISKNVTLDEHLKVCKRKMEMTVYKIANLAKSCMYPTRIIQLFFIILKSVIDYGSSIYTKIKAKTTIEKFAKLVRVHLKKALKLKQSTPDKVVYEMIGKPEEEWNRRLKQVEMTNEELKEYNNNVEEKRDRN